MLPHKWKTFSLPSVLLAKRPSPPANKMEGKEIWFSCNRDLIHLRNFTTLNPWLYFRDWFPPFAFVGIPSALCFCWQNITTKQEEENSHQPGISSLCFCWPPPTAQNFSTKQRRGNKGEKERRKQVRGRKIMFLMEFKTKGLRSPFPLSPPPEIHR